MILICYQSQIQGGYASARAIKLVAKGVTCYAFCAPVCRSRGFCGKIEGGDAILLPPIAAERKHAVSRRRVRGLSFKLTTFSFISLKEKV